MNEQENDWDLNALDDLLDSFDGMVAEGGVDAENDTDGCEGGACKI